MNRRLLDPFQSVQLPETIEDFLEHGRAKCLAFNRRGTLLAVGTWDGWVILVDWDTRSPAAQLIRHAGMVTGLSWSRNGRYLASVGTDAQLVLWNVLEGTVEMEIALPGPATHVCLSPRPPYKALVSLTEGVPLLVDLNTGQEQRLPLISDADVAKSGAPAPPPKEGAQPSAGALACFTKHAEAILVGHTRAPGGLLYVLDTLTLHFMDVVKVPNGARMLSLSLNRQGNLLLANCHDRTLRLYDLNTAVLPPPPPSTAITATPAPEGDASAGKAERGSTPPPAASSTAAASVVPLLTLEEVRTRLQGVDFKAAKPGSLLAPPPGVLQLSREFKNAVDRVTWAGTCFSADSEYLVSAAASKTHHHLHVWSRMYGKLERILEGPKEGTGAVTWHPLRSCLCSVSGAEGRVLLWARAYHENWSAFAPDFKELDENAEYVEQEDEFDWATPGATGHHDSLLARAQQQQQQQQQGANGAAGEGAAGNGAQASAGGEALDVLDVVTVDPDYAFSSDEEDAPGDQLHYLPVELAPLEELRVVEEEGMAAEGGLTEEGGSELPGGEVAVGLGGGAMDTTDGLLVA